MAAPVLAEFSSPLAGWLPVVVLLVVGVGFAVVNIAASIILGPKRTGPGKEVTYESGMIPVGDAHRRFNVRFYIVAMIFLVFDVEIIFFYPWATIFARHVRDSGHKAGLLLLMEMVVFVVILLVAYFYAWEGRIPLGLTPKFTYHHDASDGVTVWIRKHCPITS